MNNRGLKPGAGCFLLFQLGLTLLFSGVGFVVSGWLVAKSALLGGLVCVIPNAYFARRLFYYQGARAAKRIVKSFYQGEALKLLLSAGLFALVFKTMNVVPLVFFSVYILVQMAFWFAPVLFNSSTGE